jgi:hypothetical protein
LVLALCGRCLAAAVRAGVLALVAGSQKRRCRVVSPFLYGMADQAKLEANQQ